MLKLVKVQTKKKISTTDRPCREDSSYNFYKCVESYFYKKRGCQYPWNIYTDLSVPVCSQFPQILETLELSGSKRSLGMDRAWWTNNERVIRTNGECPQPCNVTTYELKYEIKDTIGDGVEFEIAFKNFVFEHKDEFHACDFSCLIGEIGGNLGFFLGGSLLIIIEFTLMYVIPKIMSLKLQ